MLRPKLILVLLATMALTGCYEDDDNAPAIPDAETIMLNVDVVLPASIRAQWQNSIDWAQQNIAQAQQRQQVQVRLNLRYHDEDTEDLEQLACHLANPAEGDDTCHAIIGPYHSDNAMTFLQYAARNRLPVVMPTCTSAELQRINARNTYAWFLTESDITQCEMMISTVKTTDASDVALIYTDNTYGRSFNEWMGYYATERGIHIAGSGTKSYRKGEDLSPFLREIADDCEGEDLWILLALNDAEDYLEVMRQLDDYWFDEILMNDDKEKSVIFRYICADTSFDTQVIENAGFTPFYGITPYASRSYGFPQAYEGRFSRLPFNGEPQVYDALTIIAMGAACRAASPGHCIVNGKEATYTDYPFGPGLTDYMRAVVSSDSGANGQWDANGLASAFNALTAGKTVNISGATGSLLFDTESRTKILNTTYMLWELEYENNDDDSERVLTVKPRLHLSTAGSSSEASTTAFWELEKKWDQEFDNTAASHQLPPATDHWAVVISPSTTWANYRHQADAFAMYQLLRQYGYDDEHIVLIVEDNLATDPRNAFPGQIFIARSSAPAAGETLVNEDVRQGAVVDYHFSDLRPEDVGDILMGRQTERLPHVIHPDSTSNVFLFWSGHGSMHKGPLWGNEDAKEGFGNNLIHDIVSQMNDANTYRRMMLAVETCYSGQWGQSLVGLPDVLVLTAANAFETSKADVFDQQLGVYLSNAFARTFRSKLRSRTSITLYDLYRELYKTTPGSHVTIYNHQQYGSVYTETMQEYFPFQH
ncbi:MAG: ABC transporter substrate-binding protein [Bacteroidaceae bacterium]|nr:ABC transporter substrate-binding protein [Bacteroidaceae bacterium]